MKRRIKSILIAAMVLTLTGAAVYGAERIIVPDMTFGGNEVKLSLDQAVETMQTKGSRAETAELNRKADEAVAKGYKENASSISSYLEQLSMIPGGIPIEVSAASEDAGMTKTNEKIIKMRRDFAKIQLEANAKAELNQIEADTIETYYGVLQAAENLRVAKENLANQKTILSNTQKKYKLGTVAKIDTLTAETAVLEAQQQAAAAETAVNTARMNFNLLLGYDLMQKVTLTDSLKKIEAPKGTLAEWIESALANRNEIKGASFGAEIQKILTDSLQYRYPANSSTFMTQQNAYLQAKKAAEDAPLQIEMDIRMKYMDLQDKQRAIEVAEATLANAKEGYRLALITYDAGMNTLTDVQEAQIRSYQAGQGLAKAIADYDLAVYALEHATSVGTVRLPL